MRARNETMKDEVDAYGSNSSLFCIYGYLERFVKNTVLDTSSERKLEHENKTEKSC